ncbi:hypothetical protein [Nocardia sp. CY41]|uniref:hypothetical protein n=1 Tax=Nocardia sp. CY41 TaxID=2608686 RepID=UPI00135729AE|nr:hypothetical protein [Nocardia sp. CY41]
MDHPLAPLPSLAELENAEFQRMQQEASPALRRAIERIHNSSAISGSMLQGFCSFIDGDLFDQ